MTPTEADLQPFTDGKSDQFGFNPDYLVADDLFVDARYLTVEQLQDFRRHTLRASQPQITVKLACQHPNISSRPQKPIASTTVLLVKLQVEASLVYAESPPSRFHMDHAMDVAAPMVTRPAAMHRRDCLQIDCAARLFREYMDQLMQMAHTDGWGPVLKS